MSAHLLYRTSGSLAFLSFLGAFFVISTFITIRELRKHQTWMVFFLSVCDVIFSLKFLVTAVLPDSAHFQDGGVGCYLQAGVQQFFGLASISWSGMISLNLIIQSRQIFADPSVYSKWYHFWVWGLSIVTTVLMFSLGTIGPSGDGTCWIQGIKMRLLFFIPLLIYFSVSLSSLIIAAVYSRDSPDKNTTGMLLRMASYTAVFILCWLGPLIHRIVQVSGKSNDSIQDPNFLMFIDAIGVSIQGFMNAMIWLTNPSFLKGFLSNIGKYLPWSKKFLKKGENTPLIRKLQDEDQDPAQLAVIRRNIVLTCCFRGIGLSVKNPVQDIDCRVYNEVDLFGDVTSNASHVKPHRFKEYTPHIYASIKQSQSIEPLDYLKSFDSQTFFDNLSNQKFSEGKSGSFMCFTPDSKYIIKTITREESFLLRKKVDKFKNYLNENPSSLLLKFYGSFKISIPGFPKVYLAIMSNVFSSIPRGLKVNERYDLKGSSVNRGGSSLFDGTTLGLDNDFKNRINSLDIPTHISVAIVNQLSKDSEFLRSLNIMDYSLLIGIVKKNQLSRSNENVDINTSIEDLQHANIIVETKTSVRGNYFSGTRFYNV
eukprot:gene4756-5935_t